MTRNAARATKKARAQAATQGTLGLQEEGAASARLFGLSIHPWVLGASHRIRYLDEALSRIAGREGVWQATAGEIAAAYLRQAAE